MNSRAAEPAFGLLVTGDCCPLAVVAVVVVLIGVVDIVLGIELAKLADEMLPAVAAAAAAAARSDEDNELCGGHAFGVVGGGGGLESIVIFLGG